MKFTACVLLSTFLLISFQSQANDSQRDSSIKAPSDTGEAAQSDQEEVEEERRKKMRARHQAHRKRVTNLYKKHRKASAELRKRRQEDRE